MAAALRLGALGRLKELDFKNNLIGDEGLRCFASACSAGALTRLSQLTLSNNQIGEAGCTALGGVLGKGALKSCKGLNVAGNMRTAKDGAQALETPCSARGIQLQI